MIHIKIYSKRTENIKNIIIFISVILVMYFIFFFKLPYYVDAPGGLTNLSDRFTIEGATSSKGTYNLTYVSEYDGTIATLIYAYLNPNFDILKEKDITNDLFTMEESYKIDKISLNTSLSESVISAYNEANKKVVINKDEAIVYYIYKSAKTNLEIGDIILEVNGVKTPSHNDVKKAIADSSIGDKIIFKVSNNEKVKEKYGYVLEENGKKMVGFAFQINYDYTVSPKIKLNTAKNEYGSSGGLMTSLAIYDALIDEDLTNGLTISGTGTIDIDGNVGSIGGVKYKLKGAINNKADIFFVPNGENYDEAIKIAEEKKYDIKIIGVSTLKEAITYLENL